MELVYLNRAGMRRVDPEGNSEWRELVMPDIFSLSSQGKLMGEIVPHARVMGRWSGRSELRDVWGSEFPVQLVVTSFNTSEAPVSCLCLQAVDLTTDRAAEKASFADREFLHALLDSLPDYVYFKDKQGRYLRISRSMAQSFGMMESREAIGKTMFDFITASEAAPIYVVEQQVISTGHPILDHEARVIAPGGSVRWISDCKLPLRDSDGSIVGTFGITRDITQRKLAEVERREMENKLQLSQKLESIGRLAAGIAHEINTPTQFITDNVHFLTEAATKFVQVLKTYRALRDQTLPGDHADAAQLCVAREQELEMDYYLAEVPKTLDQSLQGLNRIARIVRSLKEFSHPNKPELSPVDLNRAIETAITVCRHEWKYVANLDTEFAADLPLVPCILDEFNQVLLNLIVNAAQAIEEKAAGTSGFQGQIKLRTRLNGNSAIVEIEDNGPGIPAKIHAHIFEPFFTTKAAGKGTGQGLAIVQNVVVVRHGGRVDFSTRQGEGTTFKLHFPLAAPRLSPANSP